MAAKQRITSKCGAVDGGYIKSRGSSTWLLWRPSKLFLPGHCDGNILRICKRTAICHGRRIEIREIVFSPVPKGLKAINFSQKKNMNIFRDKPELRVFIWLSYTSLFAVGIIGKMKNWNGCVPHNTITSRISLGNWIRPLHKKVNLEHNMITSLSF